MGGKKEAKTLGSKGSMEYTLRRRQSQKGYISRRLGKSVRERYPECATLATIEATTKPPQSITERTGKRRQGDCAGGDIMSRQEECRSEMKQQGGARDTSAKTKKRGEKLV